MSVATKCLAFGGKVRLVGVPQQLKLYCQRPKGHKGKHLAAPYAQSQTWEGTFLDEDHQPKTRSNATDKQVWDAIQRDWAQTIKDVEQRSHVRSTKNSGTATPIDPDDIPKDLVPHKSWFSRMISWFKDIF